MSKRIELIRDEGSGLKACADYHDKVREEALNLINTARTELERKYKEEHQKLLLLVGRMRRQTGIVIKAMGRAAGEHGQKVSEDKDRELRVIRKEIGRKHRQELRKAAKKTMEQGLQVTVKIGCHKECVHDERTWRVLEFDRMPGCGACSKSSTELWLCGGCETTWYCNEVCQEKDWGKHQNKCPGSTDDESENALRN